MYTAQIMKTSKTPKGQTAIRLDRETLDRLEALRARTGLSVCFIIRNCIEVSLQRFESSELFKGNRNRPSRGAA